MGTKTVIRAAGMSQLCFHAMKVLPKDPYPLIKMNEGLTARVIDRDINLLLQLAIDWDINQLRHLAIDQDINLLHRLAIGQDIHLVHHSVDNMISMEIQ